MPARRLGEGNNLVPVAGPADIEAVAGRQTNCIMQDGSFVKIDAAGGSMPAHSAYLSLPTPLLPRQTSSFLSGKTAWRR